MRLAVHGNLCDVRDTWKELETRSAGTPFQRFDWVEAWFASQGDAEASPLILVLESDGRAVGLLPLERLRRGPALVARMAGGRHCNLGAPLIAEDSRAEPCDWHSALRIVSAASAIDLVDLARLPARLGTVDNPLVALPGGGRPSCCVAVQDLGTPEDVSQISRNARRKLRQKRRWLDDMGSVAHRRATSPSDVTAVLAHFLRQKAERFAELGVPDPFVGEHAVQFLNRAAVTRLADGAPALELHWLELDGEPVAVFGAAGDGRRLSGMILSFSNEPRIARCSPGRLLLHEVIQDARSRGYRILDLGPGDMRYKREICSATETLSDVMLPLTATGHVLGRTLRLARASKQAIKRHPRLRDALNSIRRSRLPAAASL